MHTKVNGNSECVLCTKSCIRTTPSRLVDLKKNSWCIDLLFVVQNKSGTHVLTEVWCSFPLVSFKSRKKYL